MTTTLMIKYGFIVIIIALLLGEIGVLNEKRKQRKFTGAENKDDNNTQKRTDNSYKSPLEIIFDSSASDEKRRKAAAEYEAICNDREKQRKEHQKQVLEKWGLTEDGSIEKAQSKANDRNYKNGVYHVDSQAPYGSVDNPEVVGMPEYSNSLHFSIEREHWILTDGLGNGWIR